MADIDRIKAALAAGRGLDHESSVWLVGECERLTRALAEEKAAHRETFESARKLIVSDEPPSEEAMRYGREVVAPRVTAEFAAARGLPPIEACTIREPDSCSGVFRCFLDGGGLGVVGKGDSEVEAYADFVSKAAAKLEVKP